MGFVNSCFSRKPIALMAPEGEGVLRRALGAGDLIMLAIGAVIGAGIFGAIGTATAGEFEAALVPPSSSRSFWRPSDVRWPASVTPNWRR